MTLTPRIDRLENNYLINGAFDFWQRGTTRSAPIFGGYAYTADRWALSGGNGFISAALVRQSFAVGQTDVPGNPTYYGRIFGVGSPGVDAYLEQRVEGVRLLAGKTMTFSCWVKRESGGGATGGVFIKVRNNFGTGGSPSAEVEFFTTEETFTTLDQWVYVTATFTVPSLAGKTIGTAGNDYVAVAVVCKQTGWNIAQCMLNDGDTPLDFVRCGKHRAQELALCQRYYEKSYDVDTAPGTATTNGIVQFRAPSTSVEWPVIFKVSKRAPPTTVCLDPVTGGFNSMRNFSASTSSATNAGISQGTSGFFAQQNPSGTQASQYGFHWTADAEL